MTNSMQELFYRDPYVRRFQAKVLSCEPVGDAFDVELDDTAFYPEGGGQPCDLGTLSAVAVTDVKRREGRILHRVGKAFAVGEQVEGEIDWERRLSHMQNHTGEHIVSGLVHQRFGYENVGFHMDETLMRCDFNGEITPEELSELEQEANEAIRANRPVVSSFPNAEELSAMQFRSKKELSGTVRIVDAGGFDCCACCGTHVRTTGEVQCVKFLSLTRHRGGVRVEFVCGMSALKDYEAKLTQNRRISELLSAKPGETALAVERFLEDLHAKEARITELTHQLLLVKAAGLKSEAGRIVAIEAGLTQRELRELASILIERADVDFVLAASASETQESVINYAMATKSIDARSVSRALNAKLDGRGGGGSQNAQGFYKTTPEKLRSAVLEVLENV